MGKKKALFFGNKGAEIPLDKLVLYQRFNNSISDETGNCTASTLYGLPYVNGLYSNNPLESISIPNTYLDINDNDLLSFGDGITDIPFSVSFIISFDSHIGKNNHFIYCKRGILGNPNVDIEWQIQYNISNGDAFSIVLWGQDSTEFIRVFTQEEIPIDTPTHITITYDGSSTAQGIKIYYDAILQPLFSNVSGTYIAMNNKTAPLRIGGIGWIDGANVINGLDGKLDGAGVWRDIELTQEQITNIYNKQLNGQELL